jgi:predicted acyl esterase
MRLERFAIGRWAVGLLIILIQGTPIGAHAEQLPTQWVEMPDGVLLATEVWLPDGEGPFPTVLIRTPYGRFSEDTDLYTGNGYATVVQDLRGTGESEGEYESNRTYPSDGHAAIEWTADQVWSDGTVGMVGNSALGVAQYAVAQGAPPALKCLRPGIASPDYYHHNCFQGGALRYDALYPVFRALGMLDLFEEIKQRRLWDAGWEDRYWLSAPETIRVPMLHIGGWFDTFQQGALDAFMVIQHQGGVGAAGNQYLVMDPLTHYGSHGQIRYPNLDPDLSERLTLDWLAYWLKDEPTGVDRWPSVRVYLMGAHGESGAPGNRWVEMTDWPPEAKSRSLHLNQDGALTEEVAPAGRLVLTIDPNDPVATFGGANLVRTSGSWDQSFFPPSRPIESRSDVLTFTSEPLEEPTYVVGRVTARIWIDPDTPDLDLSVRLTDVYPDGKSMLIDDGIQRARMRCGDDLECFLTPGVPTEITVDLWSTAMVFNRGHRIRVAIAGTNWDRFEINSNDGGDLNDPSYVPAYPEILFGADHPSAIELPISVDRFAPAPRRVSGRLTP